MSEFRQDIVSGDWIISSPERAKRPHDFLPEKKKREEAPKDTCPFENLEESGNWPPILSYPSEKNWKIVVVQNKYPALNHNQLCADILRRGPYKFSEGIGHHDLVITKNHTKNIVDLSPDDAYHLFETLQKRYLMMVQDKCLLYTAMFFNWGESSGASVSHPHYQMLTLPIIPPDVEASLIGSKHYYEEHRRCVHCDILDFELKNKNRIVDQNVGAIAITPYVSRQPFEMRIYPKKHQPYFESTSKEGIRAIVAVLQSSLRRMKKYLNDPDFNFFVHTSPLKDREKYKHYHWHIEIIPKISIPAGFELSTGVDINVIDPDRAAAILLGKKF